MKKQEFKFRSTSDVCDIRAVRWLPDKDPIAVLQISHGMVEFIDRYELFAEFLCSKGFVVTGNDHIGHGESVNSIDDWGYFADKDGNEVVLDDLYEVTKITKELYPNLPYFLLGHSMGSFFARYYIQIHGNELDGAIIMGTGEQSAATLVAGKQMCRAIARFKGWHYRSKTVNGMALGSYNKKWEPSNTHLDWLTKDEEIVSKYKNEPRNSFLFTLNGYLNLFSVIGEVIKKYNIEKVPKDLPILVTSGEDDPVGDFSKSPKLVYETFVKAGIQDVEIKLYPKDRHEILNELDKIDVYSNIYHWLESKIK